MFASFSFSEGTSGSLDAKKTGYESFGAKSGASTADRVLREDGLEATLKFLDYWGGRAGFTEFSARRGMFILGIR